MQTIRIVTGINAPAEQVFALLCDVENWPNWTSTMTSVRRLEGGPLTVGSSARVQQPKLRTATWQVTALDVNRNFTWATRAPGLHMKAGHLVEPQGAHCQVQLTLEVSGFMASLVSFLYGGVIGKYIKMEAAGLKQASERSALIQKTEAGGHRTARNDVWV